MKFNLNKLLLSLSYTLDFVEIDILGVSTNHSKRVAYIALLMGKELGMTKHELFDLVSCALLHDNGATKYMLNKKNSVKLHIRRKVLENLEEHCIIGEENLKNYPFWTDTTNVIKYHHETYSGTGFFGIKGEEIPLMSRLIYFADRLDVLFNLKNVQYHDINNIKDFVITNAGTLFDTNIVETFLTISKKAHFWLDLHDEFLNRALNMEVPKFQVDMSWDDIECITSVFSNIIDSKSIFTRNHSKGLAEKASIMGRYYNKNEEEIIKLRIAGELHDLGKLAISNEILDKPDKLTEEEIHTTKNHVYFSRVSLEPIDEFREITQWAANHHERLDGSGYPYGLTEKDLDFNSRLIMCLDVYQALREERPYRKGLSHEHTIKILENMVTRGHIDKFITDDIKAVLKDS